MKIVTGTRPSSHGRILAAALAAVTLGLLGLLAGCTGDADAPAGRPAGEPASGEPWYDEVAAAAPSAGTTGGAGTACPLPVAFPLAEGWLPKPVEVPEGELGELLGEALASRGGATARCEVDGRRAGGGFLRVWTADQPAARRAALEAFVADGGETVTDQRFREVRAGSYDGTETTWLTTSSLTDEPSRHWALAVEAQGQTLLLTVDESLIADRTDVLPAYRLATAGLTAR
ncbi:lipoprotein [Micromonospora sp. GCM10011542]|uniref:lipoprotein n=1 Tax=Micromonospora sp. GCM10011542 TaxID=3317337 RepID=UPI003606F1DC